MRIENFDFDAFSLRKDLVKEKILKILKIDKNRTRYVFGNNVIQSNKILELHTYSYRKDKFGLTNTYWTLKYVRGLNFLRKR